MSSSPARANAERNCDQASSFMYSSPLSNEFEKDISNDLRSSALSPTNSQTRPLAEIIGETFPPFDHQATVAAPFNDELERDVSFERELTSMLLNAMLETHAWASARPKHESTLAAQNIEEKVFSLMETEKQQGMSLSHHEPSLFRGARLVDKMRQQLHEFVTQIKSALAVLTGFTRT